MQLGNLILVLVRDTTTRLVDGAGAVIILRRTDALLPKTFDGPAVMKSSPE